MTKKIIFVTGIHGVGKTYICHRIKESMDINHFSASQLIREFKSEKLSGTDKGVKNINDNQEVLLKAIEKFIEPTRPTLLDGHCCLLNSIHEVERIPLETFVKIKPCSIIVLYDTISSISKKISERDGISYNDKLLSRFQNEEIRYSKEIAEHLQIPYLEYDVSKDFTDIINFIKDLDEWGDK